MSSLQLKDSHIKIEKAFGSVPKTQGDPNQLKQVFLNLINNATYAMQNEGILKIDTWVGNGDIHVSVSDTGRGIPKELQPRIFEPFFSTKKDKGTGIGLSVSYKIIQSHNGRIEVLSQENEGSTFTVVLPVA
ncbi:MAG: ATP-binding protein [Nitrospirota bacterium]